MKLKFKTQAYQSAAVQAVVDCFKGQPPAAAEAVAYRMAHGQKSKAGQALFTEAGFRNADLALNDLQLQANIHEVQRNQNLVLSKAVVTTSMR